MTRTSGDIDVEHAPLVVARNLSCVFDVSKPWLERVIAREPKQSLTAVAGVSFELARGETLALVGESGSGKSTIARMVVGLQRPTAGAVTIDGITMTDMRRGREQTEVRRRIQMIFQDPLASLNPRWRVDRIIAEPIRAFGLYERGPSIEERVSELLQLVRLDPADAHKYPHEFSGGQRQRIAIARAISINPEFIVCDEPTSALDVSVQAQILNLMRDLQDRFGLTYLFISHNLAVVRQMASHVGVMYLGRLVELGSSSSVFRQPRHPYTRMLLDAVPDIAAIGRERKPLAGEMPNPINPPAGCAFHPRCPLADSRCREELPGWTMRDEARVACHAVQEGRI